jgi:hypothetical protein
VETGVGAVAAQIGFPVSALAGYYKVARFYSPLLSGNQAIGSGGIGAAVYGWEGHTLANAEWEVQVFVIDPANAVRGSIWRTSGAFAEMAAARCEGFGSGIGANVNALHGDRIAVEIYFNETGTRATSAAFLFNGATGSSGDTRVTLGPATILFQPEGVVSEIPIGVLYLNPTSGLRTQLGSGIAGMIPVKVDPTTGQRGITSSLPKFMVVSNSLRRAVS